MEDLLHSVLYVVDPTFLPLSISDAVMPSAGLLLLIALGATATGSPIEARQGVVNIALSQAEQASRGAENVARQARTAANKWLAGKAVIAPESEDAVSLIQISPSFSVIEEADCVERDSGMARSQPAPPRISVS